jgi:hypothetical protein
VVPWGERECSIVLREVTVCPRGTDSVVFNELE